MPYFDHFGWMAPLYENFINTKPPKFLLDVLNLPVNGLLLDAGGGTGRVAQFMVGSVNSVVVADLSCRMLEKAKGKAQLSAVCSPTEAMPFADGAFARIIMVDALHHVVHHHDTIKELWRLLAPGGRLVIEEPDIRSLRVKLIALAEKLILMRSHFLSPNDIRNLFDDPEAVVEIHYERPIAFIVVKKELVNKGARI